MELDITKPFCCRNLPDSVAKYLETNSHNRLVIAYRNTPKASWKVQCFTPDDPHDTGFDVDQNFVNIPDQVTQWIRVNYDSVIFFYNSKEYLQINQSSSQALTRLGLKL